MTCSIKIIAIRNVVSQGSIAFDLYTKSLKDGNSMIVEGPFRQVALSVSICLTIGPSAADLFECNWTIVINHIQEPNISVEIILCHMFLVE